MKPHLLILIILGLIIALSQTAFSRSTEFTIERDTVFNESIEIPDSTTWTIKPGVAVRFSGYHRLVVRGLLIAQANSRAPIVFTGVGRQSGSVDKPCWQGIEVAGPSGSARFVNCRFEGAYSNLVWGSAASFDSCIFTGNHYALYCARKAAPQIAACRFYNNIYGLVAEGAAPMVYNSEITGNTVGVYLLFNAPLASGRNTIERNQTDFKADSSLGGNTASFSLHYLWNIMKQLY